MHSRESEIPVKIYENILSKIFCLVGRKRISHGGKKVYGTTASIQGNYY